MSTDKTSAKPAESFVYCKSAITPSYFGRAIVIKIEPYSVMYKEYFKPGNTIALIIFPVDSHKQLTVLADIQ